MAPNSPYRAIPPDALRPRLERVREGAGALLLVAQTLWREPALRRFYLRVAITQSLLTLAFGAFVAVQIFGGDGESRRPKGKPAKHVVVTFDGDEPRKKDSGVVIKDDKHTIVIGPDGVDIRPAASGLKRAEVPPPAPPGAPALPAPPGAPAPSFPTEAVHAAARRALERELRAHRLSDVEREAARAARAEAARLRGQRAAAVDDGADDSDNDNDNDNDNDRDDNDRDDDDNDNDAAEAASAARAGGADHDGDDPGDAPAAAEPAPPLAAMSLWERLGELWGKLVTAYTALVVIGWIIIALSRDYHDALGRELSLRLGLPPEDPPVVPRVRVNFGWMATRMKRRLRGFMLFTLGVPPLWALSFFVVLPLLGFDLIWNVFDTSSVVSRLYGLLAGAWGAYWLIVFTTAKTALAWTEEGTAPDPWFLRVWDAVTARAPAAVAWLPRGYGRAWRNMSQRVFSPAICFERAPYEFAGLAAVRLLASVPIFYPFVRPFVPVAAALLVTRHALPDRAAAPTHQPAGWAPPVPPRGRDAWPQRPAGPGRA